MNADEQRMAQELIDHVKAAHTPRLVLLEERIAAALRYMRGVSTPNMHTLAHVERYLTGDRDGELALVDTPDLYAHAVERSRILVSGGHGNELVTLPPGTEMPGVQHGDGVTAIAAADLVAATDGVTEHAHVFWDKNPATLCAATPDCTMTWREHRTRPL